MKKLLGMIVAITVAAILSGAFVTAAYAEAKEVDRDGSFIAYENGTVLDTKTNLMWAAKDNGNDISWTDAKSYCENYKGGGYADWRMPTEDELAGLYDEAKTFKSDRRGNVHLTKLIHLHSTFVWASETNKFFSTNVSFYTGKRFMSKLNKDIDHSALPVRLAK